MNTSIEHLQPFFCKSVEVGLNICNKQCNECDPNFQFEMQISPDQPIIADKEPKDDFEKFAEQSEKDNIKWHERFESITEDKELVVSDIPINEHYAHNLFMRAADVWTDEHDWVMTIERFKKCFSEWQKQASSIPIIDKGEEAIAFAEFIAGKWKYYEGSYYSIADGFKFFKDVKYYTPEELYKLFKSQK